MRLSIFFEIPTVVQIHLVCASLCLLLGLYNLCSTKGNQQHKLLGWVWVMLMMATAISAAFIHQIRMIGVFSPIHIFVPITFWGLYDGITHARAGRMRAHRTAMRSMYWAALCIPFAFALLPKRALAYMFGLNDLEWYPMILVATIVLSVGIYYRWEKFWHSSFQRFISAK